MAEQPKQITINDIIHSDERVINLKKQYNEYLNTKNQRILDISRVEADIIKEMGAFEYLNGFSDTDEERLRLGSKFLPLIVKKNSLIKIIDEQDKLMEATTKTFDTLAQSIVEDLKKAAAQMQGNVPATESAPESALGCPCGEGCDCKDKEQQVCDHCQECCDGKPRVDVAVNMPTLKVTTSSQGQEGHDETPEVPGPEAE